MKTQMKTLTLLCGMLALSPAWAGVRESIWPEGRMPDAQGHQIAAKGLDPNRIGIMGFSAGGHLTIMSATSEGTVSHSWIDRLWEFLNHKQILNDLK